MGNISRIVLERKRWLSSNAFDRQLSMDSYEVRFDELSRYTPRLIEDPVDKVRRFRDGLKPEMKD